MSFYFLPAYSLELNQIELLWHKMKYKWLLFKLYTPDELKWAIDEMSEGFGSLYRFTFTNSIDHYATMFSRLVRLEDVY